MIFLIKPRAKKFGTCKKNFCSEASSFCGMKACAKNFGRPRSYCEALMVNNGAGGKVQGKVVKK